MFSPSMVRWMFERLVLPNDIKGLEMKDLSDASFGIRIIFGCKIFTNR